MTSMHTEVFGYVCMYVCIYGFIPRSSQHLIYHTASHQAPLFRFGSLKEAFGLSFVFTGPNSPFTHKSIEKLRRDAKSSSRGKISNGGRGDSDERGLESESSGAPPPSNS
mmetsp:Transcript_39283/g.63724  ORF Transcript_39283/g.63724 Transcript_39283/m.63724 type:complete len:110 (-) Transcript_39283:1554-1883(-)